MAAGPYRPVPGKKSRQSGMMRLSVSFRSRSSKLVSMPRGTRRAKACRAATVLRRSLRFGAGNPESRCAAVNAAASKCSAAAALPAGESHYLNPDDRSLS